MSRVVISLVTWNSAKDLPACLDAMASQTFHDTQLVIVDNASTDGTAAVIKKLSNSVIIFNSDNRGYAGAHNQAMRWAAAHGAEFVLVLNPDVVLAPNAIGAMVDAMEQYPKAGSVGIPLLRDDTTIDSLGLDVGWGGRFFERGAGEQYEVRDDNLVLGISGACALYRLAALDEVAYHAEKEKQYFDERFFAYKEDVDLALRLRARGWEAWLTHGATARHTRTIRHDRPREERGRTKNYFSYRNHLFVLKKHWKNISTPHWQIVVYELGKAAYALVREPWLLKAWVEIIKTREHKNMKTRLF